MNRLTCTVHDINFDITAPCMPQMISFIRRSADIGLLHLHRIAQHFGRPIKYIVDVGACIGGYSLSYMLAFPDAKILAIEPSKWNYPHLEHNTKPFSNIKRIKCLVADKEEILTIAGPTETQRPKLDCNVNTGLISIYGKGHYFRENVPSKLLDNLVRERVDWLKIDVEGAEFDILQGSTKILLEHRPIIQIEIKPENQQMAGRNVSLVHQTMRDFGYKAVGGIEADWIYFPYDYQGR